MLSYKVRVPRIIGCGAGLLSVVLVIYSATGAVWGMVRPTLTGTRVDTGGYAIKDLADVEFWSFSTFALAMAAMSLVLGLVVYHWARRQRGLLTLVWLGVVALAGAAAFFVAGGLTATHVAEPAGQTITFVPPFHPGVAWGLGPFTAMLAYWVAAFVGGEEGWQDSQ